MVGAGRVESMAIHPTNSNIMYAAAVEGGVWKTTDGGATWIPTMDNMPSLNTTSVAISKSNPSILFATLSSGYVYKSIDGAATWTQVYAGNFAKKIIIHPTDPNKVVLATFGNVSFSNDGGATWQTSNVSDNIYDIEFKTDNSNIVFAAAQTGIYRSTNAGVTFTQIALSTYGESRIAVTAANANVVYVAQANASSGLQSIFKSTDAGLTYSKQLAASGAQRNNYFGYSESDEGGIAWWGMALGVSQTNANLVFIGCVYPYKSTDGGLSFSQLPVIHTDYHDLVVGSGDQLLSCNDGGVFKSIDLGLTNTFISKGLRIRQFYRIAVSPIEGTNIAGGAQDMGSTNYTAQFGWSNTTGGDGEEVTYDATNKNIFYSTFQNLGGVMRNDVSTKISTYIGSPGQGDWTAPLVADPKLTNIVYAGTADLHKYNGTSWSILLDFATTDYMQPNSIAIAPSNSNIIYAYKNGRIYTTINGGTTWNNYAVDFGFTNMRVSPSNPSRVYISSWGSVYVSNDGGVTFSIMSGTLPGLNFGALAIHSATEEYIYVGSDNGNLFYKTYTSTDWNSIGAGIPSVTIRDIEVSTTNNKLLVGTYARGIFQGNLIGQSVVNSCPDPEWVSTTAYSGGAKVSYNGNSYSAKWWTQNNQPDLNTGEGKPWSLVGPCGAVNQPPLVTFTLPVKNSVFDQNVTVNLKADAIDSDGYVTKVEFLNSSDQVVFTDVSAPFEYPLTNLAVGLYVYKAKAYDNKNLASSVSTTNFEVKVLTPSITITSPTEGQIIKVPTGGKINVNVTTNPAVVDSVKFIIVDVVCNGPGCANVRRITSTVFPYSISYDPIVGSVSSQVNAIAFKNGIGSTITAVVNYNVVNLIAPIFAITSSLQGQTFYEYPSDGRKIDVTLTQQNATQAPIDSVIYRVQDIVCSGIVCTNTRTFKTSTAPFNINFDPSYTFYATAANTNTVIEATAYSKGVASEVKTLLLKVKPLPELTIVTPVNNVSVNKNLATIPIDVNVNSGQITIDSVVYTVYDTKLVGQTALTTTRKFNVQYPYDLDLPVVGGMNYTKVFALAYGNGGKFSRVQDIQINYNEVPTVYITDPSSSYKFNIGGSVTIKATVGDVDGTIAKVEIYSPHIANSKITLTAPPYEATFANLESSGMRGATSFVVVATDNQGGVNGASIDVAENKLPYIQVTSPVVVNSINPKYVVGGNITVAASIGDYDGTITKVEFYNGITNAGMVTLTAAPYSVNFTNLPAPFVDGSYSFKIKAYDSDGGVSEKLIVVYKNRIPSVTITSPVNNPNFNVGATIPISFLPYDPDWTSGKVEFFNGTTKLGEQLISGVLNGTAYTYNLSGLVAGNYNITVRATDDMNESGSANVSFTVGNSVCSVPAWSPLTAYNGATRVSKNGTIYEAKWWTQNNDPLTNSGQWDVWKIIGACNARLAEIESKVNVAYPNPFNNILNVSATVNSSLAQVYLLNLNGEVLFTNQVASIDGNITCVFETANLVSGIYIVKIVAGHDVTTYKVVK